MREPGSGFRPRLRRMLAAALLPLLLGGCGAGCAEEVVQHEPSPYGSGAAMVFVRDCGETGGVVTQVALIGHVDAEARERNVFFAADTNDGAAPSSPAGGPRVRVRWIDATHLEVAHHPRARAIQREAQHGPVRITYVSLPDADGQMR
ncbi:MAG TPA: hypothetical protein VLK84_12960 [Longimicrobium sp.]|nr:hypothetical protein [Longimicrobium sp.]